MENRRYPRQKLQLKLVLKIDDPGQVSTPYYFSAQTVDVSAGGMLIQSRGLSVPAYQYFLAGGSLEILFQRPKGKRVKNLDCAIIRVEQEPETLIGSATCKLGISFKQEQESYNQP